MSRSSEEISKNTSAGEKTDSNISNDSLHLGGIPAEDFATQKYVQNYHDTKEKSLKQYIDNQDTSKLNEAKAYADKIVSGQDFSNFAKLNDIQVLKTDLTNQIKAGDTEQKNYTDTKTKEIVNDVNELSDNITAKFNNVDSSINTLNTDVSGLMITLANEINERKKADTSLQSDVNSLETTTQELFTSVSNGKRKVATAITDKGVHTASDASFEIMADNIEKITSGSGEGIDTSDATATASDIALGKTAYVKGNKVYGIHEDLDTSDATATEDDIMFGKTAYVDGSKVYGVHEDLDTSDADATENDIMLGKSAYVNGDKIYGAHEDLDTSDADATEDDIAYGKTAYVDGVKIYGTHEDLDTSDADATEQDIMLGKSAYVDGVKITGVHTELDTSDATATQDDIIFGKTAYVNGSKVFGTYIADETKEYPTYGTDTSGATALSPEDIVEGKTAYSNGELIIGTLKKNNLNPNVDEIFKAVDEEYSFQENSIGTGEPPDGQPKTVYRRKICMSHNADYVVILGASVSSPSTKDYYIESFPVGENGIYYSASSGVTSSDIVYKKYRYTRDELGIEDDETINDIILGAPGLNGIASQCFLVLKTSKGLRFYTYHLRENGVIGKEYNSQNDVIYNELITNADFQSSAICPSAILSDVFYAIQFHNYYRGVKIKKGKLQNIVQNGKIIHTLATDNWYSIIPNSPYEDFFGTPYFTRDGKYIIFNQYSSYHIDGNDLTLFELNSGGSVIGGNWANGNEYNTQRITLFDSNIGINFVSGSQPTDDYVAEIKVFELIHNDTGDSNNIKKNIIKTVRSSSMGSYEVVGSPIITPDNSKIFTIIANRIGNSKWVYSLAIFDVNEILQAEEGGTIEPTISNLVSSAYYNGTTVKLASNFNCTKIKMYGGSSDNTPFMIGNFIQSPTDTLLGIKYKGMYFHKIQDQVLTAGQPDVKKGKTFIGWQGYPETGTMETSDITTE